MFLENRGGVEEKGEQKKIRTRAASLCFASIKKKQKKKRSKDRFANKKNTKKKRRIYFFFLMRSKEDNNFSVYLQKNKGNGTKKIRKVNNFSS